MQPKYALGNQDECLRVAEVVAANDNTLHPYSYVTLTTKTHAKRDDARFLQMTKQQQQTFPNFGTVFR